MGGNRDFSHIQMESACGSFIAFATAPGSTAADGAGRNGLYTQYLLQSLQQPDSDIDKVFRRVTADVSKATSGRQVPWIAHSLTGNFYFRLEIKVPASALGAIVDPRADDRALWATVKDSNNPDELRAYLEQFPNGLFAAVARARMKSLASTGRPPAAPAPPTQVSTIAPPTTAAAPPSPAAALGDSLKGLTSSTAFRDCDDCSEMVVIPAGTFIWVRVTSQTRNAHHTKSTFRGSLPLVNSRSRSTSGTLACASAAVAITPVTKGGAAPSGQSSTCRGAMPNNSHSGFRPRPVRPIACLAKPNGNMSRVLGLPHPSTLARTSTQRRRTTTRHKPTPAA